MRKGSVQVSTPNKYKGYDESHANRKGGGCLPVFFSFTVL